MVAYRRNRFGTLSLCFSMILSDLASPAEAGFAKRETGFTIFGIML